MLPAPAQGRGVTRQSQNPSGGGSADGEPPAPRSADVEPGYLKRGFFPPLQIPSEKSLAMLLFPLSLFPRGRIKRPYFLRNALAAQRIKPRCLKALRLPADVLALGKASAPRATKAMSSPKCHRCPPGWGIHHGMLGKDQEEKPNPPLSSPVSPHRLPCPSGTQPCHSACGCKRLFYS